MHSAPGAAGGGTRENLGQLTRALASRLRAYGVPSPELDARLLVCHACGLTHEEAAANPERMVSDAERERIGRAIERRCAREPVSRITGRREFRGLDFAIGPSSLDPRADTETLVQAVLELAGENETAAPVSILDLGTGSGCVLVALLHELAAAAGVGVDANLETLRIARANALRHGVGGRAGFVCSSWAEPIGGRFDFVVANPPYIPSAEIASLEPEVARYDPRSALDGGADGLAAYRAILAGIDRVLTPGGWAAFEVGAGQSAAVGAMFGETEGGLVFGEIRQWEDLSRRIRCVAGRRLRSV
ncbi:MAG TPA: peptide chain release factor N(5)-glutamine methyltransferase [Rhizobiales bacterium]|nr:release factor glutamine methyltransferase [bacterium BMS3Bbin10]HDO52134.1 peptide chain release factor N(5)-glutamine methyltransferase [Hyphomicrobiales bacterium]